MVDVNGSARVGVGLGVIVRKEGKVLLGKRKNIHGTGTWQFPGGHLEFGEELKDCARREVKEEAGIEIKNVKIETFVNGISRKEKTHYITIFAISDYKSGTVKNLEPKKCEGWEWFKWDTLPSPLFLPINLLLQQNFNPFKR